jgi:hypothetical protein
MFGNYIPDSFTIPWLLRASLQTGVSRIVAGSDALLGLLLDFVPVVLCVRHAAVAMTDFVSLQYLPQTGLGFGCICDCHGWWPGY